MAWNKREVKDLAAQQQFKALSPGAPVAYMPGSNLEPYHDSWDMKRAFEEGVRTVTWVYRCVEVIAGNQAKLPMQLHRGNSPEGELIKEDALLKVLNGQSNMAEAAFFFRKRISQQLLIGTRGAFVEVIRNRKGDVSALHLLPPEITAPVPDEKKFIKYFEVELPNGEKERVDPEKVVWIRNPHPLDPYLSLTPLEAAGLAVEIETLARLYNRNFLKNDGRGGGLIVLNSEIEEDDRRELQSRFSGGVSKSGTTSVIASENGAQYIDLGSSPREASYLDMRAVTKEEILAAFGVPESVIGNAAGRTFSNAAEEGRVFWQETMMPHLETIARSFDTIADKKYVNFDVTNVPILILSEQDRQQFIMEEFNRGLISANEYRDRTGKKKVESELSDALMVNPNLTAIGNTEKPMEFPGADQANQDPRLANAPLDVQTGETPVLEFPPDTPTDGSAGEQLESDQNIPNFDELGLEGDEKSLPKEGRFGPFSGVETKVFQDTERWEEIASQAIDRFLERQERVITEKASGRKATAALGAAALEADSIYSKDVWDRQICEDLRPIIQGAVNDSMNSVGEMVGMKVDIDAEDVQEFIDAQCEIAKSMNNAIYKEVKDAVLAANVFGDGDDDDGGSLLRKALLLAIIAGIYRKSRKERREQMAEEQAIAAYNAGLYFGGEQVGAPQKIWITRNDTKVRLAHSELDGKKVGISQGFKVGDSFLRFPKDPLAPPNLTINCRCTLWFDDE